MSNNEIRWYVGKYRVRILIKSKVKGKGRPRNYQVEALEELEVKGVYGWSRIIEKGERFTTVPRLLWRHKRE